MSVITVHSPFHLRFKYTQTHSIAHKRSVRQSGVIHLTARSQWPVRGTAAGGRFKVMSNDLPAESEPEAPSLTAVTHHRSFSSCLNFIKTVPFLTSSVSQHLCVCVCVLTEIFPIMRLKTCRPFRAVLDCRICKFGYHATYTTLSS